MIKLHHLRIGRSIFMAWQLEELGLDYEIEFYDRGSDFRAPESLKAVHPLGKSPAIEDNGMVVVESGAITAYLLQVYDKAHKWRPAPEDIKAWAQFNQWLHYPEGSVFAPVLMKMVAMQDGNPESAVSKFGEGEVALHFAYISEQLGANQYINGDEISAADFGLGCVLGMASGLGLTADYPALVAYVERLMNRPAFLKAKEKVGQ